MGKIKDLQLQVQWIGEDATLAREALAHDDFATVHSCLQAIAIYARGLGYVPAPAEESSDAA